ncbi:hypothetical protein RvY_05067 [Ramazzottius varieornatus]|uniref:Uncharacterized protein n=1 Tax=Ramazzottius varieornatus TaxID=947166 RepID=A0A1D1V3P0_RAMVA|nr:hypothetical protein RvY_05067 [Ramazzottius varieornatus]
MERRHGNHALPDITHAQHIAKEFSTNREARVHYFEVVFLVFCYRMTSGLKVLSCQCVIFLTAPFFILVQMNLRQLFISGLPAEEIFNVNLSGTTSFFDVGGIKELELAERKS